MTGWPSDVIDIITAKEAGTLPGLFERRVRRSPDALAYTEFLSGEWVTYSWKQMLESVARFRGALERASLEPGDRVAVLLPNGTDWVAFDIAAMANGLVTVPLYAHDSPDNMAYILANSGARLCLIDTAATWSSLVQRIDQIPALERIWVKEWTCSISPPRQIRTLLSLSEVLENGVVASAALHCAPDDVATLIYTSGTTGRPKGVMLTHAGILWNAEAITKFVPPLPGDVFLSILPLAHAFERTMGYYLPMMAGSQVAYARSAEGFRGDLKTVRPTILLAVPRLYERMHETVCREADASALTRKLVGWTAEMGWRIHEWRHGRSEDPGRFTRALIWPLLDRLVAHRILDAFGGRVRVAVSGGAALPVEVIRFLVGIGFPLVEGYGLTEAAPVVTATTVEDSLAGAVGRPLQGLEMRFGEDCELMVRSPAVMKGYWQNAEATRDALTLDGWLKTGDVAEVRDGRLYITGRLKEIIVLSTGENVVPTSAEAAIETDGLFDQACVIGDGRPCLVAIAVLDETRWLELADDLKLDPSDPNATGARDAALERIEKATRDLSSSSRVRAIHMTLTPWSIEDGTLTPTLKIKRRAIEERYREHIDALYVQLSEDRRSVTSPD